MMNIVLKDDELNVNFDYVISSVDDLTTLMKSIYKPVLGEYKVMLKITEFVDIKYVLNNKGRFNHMSLYVSIPESVYKYLILAMPNIEQVEKKSIFSYLQEGISKRSLLFKNGVANTLYMSVNKTYEDVDEILDTLYNYFGSFLEISEKDLSKFISLNKIVYPRSVLLSYIKLDRHRKSKLNRCLADINNDIVIAAMVKNLKKIHEQKLKYLSSGLGTDFIKNINTKNLNLMYYLLVTSKPYHFNDVVVLMEMYERGISINDLLLKELS